jgi:hypothetical protein
MQKENSNTILSRIFYKFYLSFGLPNKHEEIMLLLAKDHFEQPLYFK